uniref:MI domain-containing protein n=1 Tax=Panagrolaimus davidi TaxID=227884 RepID=A0A914P203_9BILA
MATPAAVTVIENQVGELQEEINTLVTKTNELIASTSVDPSVAALLQSMTVIIKLLAKQNLNVNNSNVASNIIGGSTNGTAPLAAAPPPPIQALPPLNAHTDDEFKGIFIFEQPTRLCSTKKSWGAVPGSNAYANSNSKKYAGAPPPASNKGGNQRVIARQSADARHNTNDARSSNAHRDNKPSVAPTPKLDSRSASTTPPPNDSLSSCSKNNTPTVASEDQFNKAAFKAGFKERLQSHLDNNADIDATVKSLIEFNNELDNPVLFFEQMFKYCCEHLKLSEEKERHTVSALVAKCCKDPVWKNAFAPAFKKYCKYLVDEDVEGDLPHLKTIFPQFVARLITDTNGVSNLEFVEGFKEFHDSGNVMFARTLAEFGRILHTRKESAGGPLGFVFQEFATADEHYKSDDMQKILANQPIDYDENHKNLKELITDAFKF